MRRGEQPDPLCESEKPHSVDRGQHWAWLSVGHTHFIISLCTESTLSGISFAGTLPSKRDSIMVEVDSKEEADDIDRQCFVFVVKTLQKIGVVDIICFILLVFLEL